MESGIIEDEQNLYDWGIENRLGTAFIFDVIYFN